MDDQTLELFQQSPTELEDSLDTPEKSLLPTERLERVWAWGMADSSMSYVYRPTNADQIRDIYDLAKRKGLHIAFRGAGRSYGDASILDEEIVVDLTRMRRILKWDSSKGIISVEPGVTIRDIWQYTIEDGWWPYVVSGTMFPTIAGAISMNIHGKNNFAVGPIGDHVINFDILLPSGEIRHCSREKNSELFFAAIGGFGMLGCFVQITLELKKVYSGDLSVEPIRVESLADMFQVFEEREGSADYLVGWIDCFARGSVIGRGVIHQANYLNPGEDVAPAQSLRVENQELPDTILGILPKSIMWRLMKPFVNDFGTRWINALKFASSKLGDHKKIRQSHAGFAFLLDYVPNWKWAYKPGGLVQYQSFIPRDKAYDVFARQIVLQQQAGLPSYLGVFKRHRPDDFLMTHGLDGFSVAFDFKVTNKNRDRLWKLAAEMNKLVVQAGGRFYFAKDSTLTPDSLEGFMNEERVQKFLRMKQSLDPDNILQNNLYRRLFKIS